MSFPVIDDDLVGVVAPEKNQPQTKNNNANKNDSSNSNSSNNNNALVAKELRKLKMTIEQNGKTFDARKRQILSDLAQDEYTDLSPKGSIDEGCLPIMRMLNAHADYVTTSSCSGRISVFHMATAASEHADDDEQATPQQQQQQQQQHKAKRGDTTATAWVFISHDPVRDNPAKITDAISEFCAKFGIRAPPELSSSSSSSDAQKQQQQQPQQQQLEHQLTFNVESFCLHVSCRNSGAAQALLAAAVQAGFRNSGAMLAGAGSSSSASSLSPSSSSSSSPSSVPKPPSNITVAIRHTAVMSVPLVFGTELAVSPRYLASLIAKANRMMDENASHIRRLEREVAARLRVAVADSAAPAAASS